MTYPSVSFYLRGLFVVSGLAFFAACQRSNEQAVATVGKTSITLSDFKSRLQDTPPAYQQYTATPEGRRQFLNLLVREKLLLLEGQKAGFQKEENYKKAVARFKEKWQRQLKDYEDGLLIEMSLARLRSTTLSVTDADIRRYYDEHSDMFTHPMEIQASHILVSSPEVAEKVLAQLKSGASFEALARSVSMDPSTAVRGGKLTPFTPGTLLPEFENAVMPLKVGQMTDVVKTPFGYHIIKKLGQRPLPPKTFEQAKEEIQNRLQREKFDQWVTQTQAALGVKIDESALAAVSPAPGTTMSVSQPEAASPAREMEPVR